MPRPSLSLYGVTALAPLLAAALVLPAPLAPAAAQDQDPQAVRYVRVELHGPERILSLAEVQVIRSGRNVAEWGVASQSGTHGKGAAVRAIDGSWDGNWSRSSVTHTPEGGADPWWELDLTKAQLVDQVTLWNRTDCCGERLEGFDLLLLDEARQVVWVARQQPAPQPRADFTPWGAAAVTLERTPLDRGGLQPRINEAIWSGARRLMEAQQRDGSWGGHVEHGCGQTALAVYALLKAGVPRTHASVVRGLAYMQATPPHTTYSVGCTLMALGALGEERHREWMEAMVRALEDWQNAPNSDTRRLGLWGYPDRQADLSNTQYAALGLRAAKIFGIDVAEQVWFELLQGLVNYQEATPTARRRKSAREAAPPVAGFRYRSAAGKATGSMTTAGVACIAICEWALDGRLNPRLRRLAQASRERGLAWLAHNFSVDMNPGKGTSRLYYYLYGLERVGGLLALDKIGKRDWYWEGADFLVDEQKDKGGWSNTNDTCFAILFLSRATAAASGRQSPRVLQARTAEDPRADVHWRVTGENPVTMFVTGFGEAALSDYDEVDGLVRGLRIVRVDYCLGDEVLLSVAADPSRGWTSERFPARHTFPHPGTFRLTARVHVLDPFATGAGSVDDGRAAGSTAELRSDPLEVVVKDMGDLGMLEYPSQGRENLLAGRVVEAVASSEKGDGAAAHKAIDGFHSTAWIAAQGDSTPTLTLELRRPVRANTILFSHVDASPESRGHHDRATKVLVGVNRAKQPIELILSADSLRKTTLRLPKVVNLRRLTIEIIAREPGSTQAGAVGFAEIELLLVR